MPRKYEAIRDDLIQKGMNRDLAEMHAARIYNSQRQEGEAPVGRNSDSESRQNKSKAQAAKRASKRVTKRKSK